MGGTPAIQGLPPGASVSPIQGLPPGATTTPIQGMPAGASTQPMGAASSQGDDGHWYDPIVSAAKGVGNYEKGALQGFGQSAAGVVAGAAKFAERSPEFAPMAQAAEMIPGVQQGIANVQAEADKPLDTMAKKHGALIENILEFAGGEEGLKGLSIPEKAAKLAGVAKVIKEYPAIAKVLGTGLKQGALGAAQGVAHGQDAGEAATTGAVTGAGGAALEGIGQAAGNVIRKIAPTTRRIAGVDAPVLASQEAGAGATASHAADIASEPEFQASQQAAGKQIIQNTAQQAVRDSIGRLNKTRIQPDLTPSRLLPAPEDMKPYQFTLHTGEPTEAVENGTQTGSRDYFEGAGSRDYQSIPPPSGEGSVTRGGGGTVTTSDPAAAQGHLARLEEMIDTPGFETLSARAQRTMTEQAADLRQQIEDHGAYRARMSHFQPVDAEATAAQVGNFRQAADMLTRSTQDTWSKIDEVSQNKWGELRDQEQKWLNSSADNADEKLAEVRAQQQSILDGAKDQISPDELQAAQSTYKDASTLRDLHRALEKAFTPIPETTAADTGIQRTMNGGKAMKGLKSVIDSREADVQRVLGREGTANLYNMANLLKTPQKEAATKGIIGQMGMVMRRHGAGLGLGAAAGAVLGHGIGGVGYGYGAAAGIATEAAYRRVVNAIATNPALAARLTYAVEHNVSPRVAAPLLASMMLKNNPQ